MDPTPYSSQEGIEQTSNSLNSQDYNSSEAYKYPPNQQKVLLGMQQSNSSGSLYRTSDFNHNINNNEVKHQSSNPRLDLPRQIMQQNYVPEEQPK